MKVTIYNAISLDGFITGPDKFEDWISEADEKDFDQACSDADIIVMGSSTFDLNLSLYPIPGKENIVFTQNAAEREPIESITFSNNDPVSFIRENEGKAILVAGGGGKLNATLLKAGVATDIVVSIHPVILGDGIRQFDGIDFDAKTNLTKVSEKDIGDGVTQIHYTVN